MKPLSNISQMSAMDSRLTNDRDSKTTFDNSSKDVINLRESSIRDCFDDTLFSQCYERQAHDNLRQGSEEYFDLNLRNVDVRAYCSRGVQIKGSALRSRDKNIFKGPKFKEIILKYDEIVFPIKRVENYQNKILLSQHYKTKTHEKSRQRPEEHFHLKLASADFEECLGLRSLLKKDIIFKSHRIYKRDQKASEAPPRLEDFPILIISESIQKKLSPNSSEKDFEKGVNSPIENLTQNSSDHLRVFRRCFLHKLQRGIFFSRLSKNEPPKRHNTKYKARKDTFKLRKPKNYQNKKLKAKETNRKISPKMRKRNNICGILRRKRMPFANLATNRGGSNPSFPCNSSEEKRQKINQRNGKNQDEKNEKQKDSKTLQGEERFYEESSQLGVFWKTTPNHSSDSMNILEYENRGAQIINSKKNELDPDKKVFQPCDFTTMIGHAQNLLDYISAFEKRKLKKTEREKQILNRNETIFVILQKKFTTENKSRCFETIQWLRKLFPSESKELTEEKPQHYYYETFAEESLELHESIRRVFLIKFAIEFIIFLIEGKEYKISVPRTMMSIISKPAALIHEMIKKAKDLWSHFKTNFKISQHIEKLDNFEKMLIPINNEKNLWWKSWKYFLKMIEVERKQLVSNSNDREPSPNNTSSMESHSIADQVNDVMDQLGKPKKKIKRDPSAYLQTDQNQLNPIKDYLFSFDCEGYSLKLNFLGLVQIPGESLERIPAKIDDLENLVVFEF